MLVTPSPIRTVWMEVRLSYHGASPEPNSSISPVPEMIRSVPSSIQRSESPQSPPVRAVQVRVPPYCCPATPVPVQDPSPLT